MLNEDSYYTFEQLNNVNEDSFVDNDNFAYEDADDSIKEEREIFCEDYSLNSIELEDMDALDMENELMLQLEE